LPDYSMTSLYLSDYSEVIILVGRTGILLDYPIDYY
jgi:hypothetical protein